jgi:hypothetical protein
VQLGIFGACALATPIAYFAVNYYGAPNEPLANTQGPQVSALEAQIAAPPPMPAIPPESAPPPPPEQSPSQPPQSPAENRYRLQRVAPTEPGATNGIPAAGENLPAAPAVSSAPSPALALARPTPTDRRPAPTIAAEDIAMLLERGEQFISVGDVAAARVLFERAAEAGDASAALALGATYDPVVLAQLGVRGIAPDATKAQLWYQKAREHGSPEAPAWLAKIARR